MFKRHLGAKLAAFCAAVVVAGCGGGGGSAASPPVLLTAQPGDGQVTLTWQSAPGTFYWLWWVQAVTTVTIGDSGNAVGAEVNVVSPYVMTNLYNTLPYSFALNAHAGNPNGPGGPASNSLTATPRFAGSSWVPCTAAGNVCPSGTPTLYAVAHGDNSGILANDGGTIRNYLAVGSGGSMYVSYDSKSWTQLPAQPSCTPSAGGALRAADYGWGTYVAAGDNGTVCFSGPTSTNPSAMPLVATPNAAQSTWMAATSLPAGVTTTNFYGIATNQNTWNAQAGDHVLVGSGGKILVSGDGQNWIFSNLAAANTGTSNDLYGVTFNFCALPNWDWVAVGASGTIIASGDPAGINGWTTASINSNTTSSLRGVACTANSTPSLNPLIPAATVVPLWVAVGDNGVLLNSLDGVNWATPNTFTINGVAASKFPVNMKAVFFGTQFVAVGDGGSIYTSIDGATWTSQSSGAGSNALYGIAAPKGTLIPNGYMGSVPFGYSVVGAGGITTFAQ
jgi:hypothetical protein